MLGKKKTCSINIRTLVEAMIKSIFESRESDCDSVLLTSRKRTYVNPESRQRFNKENNTVRLTAFKVALDISAFCHKITQTMALSHLSKAP